MAFLNLNGLVIPVASKQATEIIEDLGSTGRSFDGSYFIDRRKSKRKWSITTTPVNREVANQIIGTARGLGHSWNFDWGDDNVHSQEAEEIAYYSSKGLAPTGVKSLLYGLGTGTVPFPVYYYDGSTTATESRNGSSGALEVSIATTNIVTSLNVANGSEDGTTAGWDDIGVPTKSSETVVAVQGSRSLKLTLPADGVGSGDASIPVAINTNYTASAYVYVGTSGNVKLTVTGDGAFATDTVTAAVTAGRWTRITNSFLTTGTQTVANVYITGAGSGIDIYIDGVMVQGGLFVTPWQTTAAARSTGALIYSGVPFQTFQDFTLMCWIKPRLLATVAPFSLAIQDAAFENQAQLRAPIGGTIEATLKENALTIVTAASAAVLTNNTWSHIAAVFRRSLSEGNAYYLEVYHNGTLVASDATLNNTPTESGASNWTGLYIGGYSACDDLYVLPYTLSATTMANWVSITGGTSNTQTDNPPPLPRIWLYGDETRERGSTNFLTEVYGQVTNIQSTGGKKSTDSAWTNKFIISLDIFEA